MGVNLIRASPLLLLPALIITFVVVVPIGFLVLGVLWSTQPGRPGELTLSNLTGALSSRENVPLLVNSIVFSLGSTMLGLAFAASLAWVVHRTDTPGRRILDLVPLLAFVFPSFLGDIAWTFLLSPRIGLINLVIKQVFGLENPLFNIYTLEGMIWSQALGVAPIAYLLISGAFATMDPSLEEAARASGASPRSTAIKITVPLLYPSLLASGTLLFMIGMHSFETPVFIGLPGGIRVFMNRIYENIAVNIPPNYGLGTSLSVIFLVISALIMAFYIMTTRRLSRYVVVTGKGYRPRPMRLGRWKYLSLAFVVAYISIGIILPLVTLSLVSLVPYYSVTRGNPFTNLTLQSYAELLSAPLMLQGLFNSVTLSVVAAFLTTASASFLSYAALKARLKGKRLFELVGILPIVFPGIIFSLALLWTSLTLYRSIYGTIWILVIAYVVILLPYATRTISNSVLQIHNELEEVARVSGATWSSSFRRVMIPLLRPALANTFVQVFIHSYRQLGAAVLLVTPGTYLIPVLILTYWNAGLLPIVSAATLVYGGSIILILIIGRALNTYMTKARKTER